MWNEKRTSEDTQLVPIDDMRLEDTQLAEQLYNNAGLNPVVEAGLKDYDKRLQKEDKVINKVLGPRASDIRGYGDAVAKRVALAVYALLNRQYGGRMGDLRSYIMTLEDERNRATNRYDELMGRVVGILGEEYRELRTDSNTFMEKLTTVLGEDLKQSRLDQGLLAEKLADIDGLRSQVKSLTEAKAQLEQEHRTALAGLDAQLHVLEADKAAMTTELARLNGVQNEVVKTVDTLCTAMPDAEMGESLGEEVYAYLLKDSKVPHTVIDGVGKFIDFKRYLRLAATRGAEEATRRSTDSVRGALQQ